MAPELNKLDKNSSIANLYCRMSKLIDILESEPGDIAYEEYIVIQSRLTILCISHHNLTPVDTVRIYIKNGWININPVSI